MAFELQLIMESRASREFGGLKCVKVQEGFGFRTFGFRMGVLSLHWQFCFLLLHFCYVCHMLSSCMVHLPALTIRPQVQ